MNTKTRRRMSHSRWLSISMAFMATLMALPTHAAIDIPDVPPTSGNGVPPNILFILDDSGSMQQRSMPEDEDDLDDNIFERSYVHNSIYYNPNTVYRGWMQQDNKTRYPDTPAINVYTHPTLLGYASPDDLSAELDLTKNDTDLTNADQTFYVLNADAGDKNSPSSYAKYILQSGGSGFRKCSYSGDAWLCAVSATTLPWGRTISQEWQNFANWYSYHRTRMKVAKAGAAEAFAGLQGDKYRVGFATIWGGGGPGNTQMRIPVTVNKGLFSGQNRVDWFKYLFEADADNHRTPLLPALQRAGEYFSETGADGPYGDGSGEQFACRQNFSILTTDGYWNSKSNYTSVGNADNAGATVKYPSGDDFTSYTPTNPYSDSYGDTLADIAMKYWKSDLVSGLANIVPVSTANPAFWQHMVTFGISIGLKGTIDQSSVAEVLATGTNGVTRTANPGWSDLSGWPDPTGTETADEDAERIDDLLHAAVNGHGQFVAATDPAAFSEGLKNALATITSRVGSSSNVAANTTSLTANSRFFLATYVGGQWSGDVQALSIVDKKIVRPPLWLASEQMPSNITGRDMVIWDSGRATPGAVEFKYSNLSTAAKAALQVPAVPSFAAGNADALGAARVDYLRGSEDNENRNAGPFRDRVRFNDRAPLGDIIHSSPYYSENENGEFLFVGANDGMLHAFDADTGAEVFAYVPGVNLTNLANLSTPGAPHKYLVDGPVVVSNQTQTPDENILVGTLGLADKGLYAIDVTDPDNFNAGDALWDSSSESWATHADLGLVTGRPFIAKLNDGRVGAIFGNGINSANGHAVLFVVDLKTGDLIRAIDTGVGGDNALSAPSGWDVDTDRDVDEVYAGDLKGNLWKFDLSSEDPADWRIALTSGNGPNAVGVPLFVATDAAGKAQPITGGVSVAIDPDSYQRFVFFGTGRLLVADDLRDLSVQTLYGIKDRGASLGRRADIDGTNTGLAIRRLMVAGTSNGMPTRGFEPNLDALGENQAGWLVDLREPPSPGTAVGERAVGQPQVLADVLTISTVIPSSDPCSPGGRGYLNAIDAFTGTSVGAGFFDTDGDGVFDDTVGEGDGEVQIGSVDTNVGMNTDGNYQDGIVGVGGSSGGVEDLGIKNPTQSGRISWREILGD